MINRRNLPIARAYRSELRVHKQFKLFKLVYTWNEVTILWNEVTIWWNEVTKGWNKVAWNNVVMERSDRNSNQVSIKCQSKVSIKGIDRHMFVDCSQPL